MNPSIAERTSPLQPPGDDPALRRRGLELGARMLQDHAPVRHFDIYVVGFHPRKDAPDQQMEAHHFCRQVNADFFQCLLFDGNTRDANLIGVEYIVSEKLFDTLDGEEQRYWHPHNYEVLSGQLVAPGIPAAAEHQLMGVLLNSYGKTWHTWQTGRHDREAGDRLPLGPPRLMWSFNRDGQSDPALEDHRNDAMGIDPEQTRARRRDLRSDAHPQRGVALLDSVFPDGRALEGVTDRDAVATE